MNNSMSILVLSCDKYQDVWDNFFDLKEKYWPDCNFQSYVVTESVKYNRLGVNTLMGGGNWAARLRNAVKAVDSPYILTFLDDYFINDKVDNKRINNYVDLMNEKGIDFLNLDDGFDHILRTPNLESFDETLVYIPKHLPYGVDTAAAIWDKQYLLDTLGEEDYSAWQFELDRCTAAKSDEGIPGLILCDKLQTLNVSKIPVIIQGAYYPPALKDFKKRGYIINTAGRHIMSCWEVFKYKLKLRFCHVKYGRRFLKWVGHYVFGFDFVSKD